MDRQKGGTIAAKSHKSMAVTPGNAGVPAPLTASGGRLGDARHEARNLSPATNQWTGKNSRL